ncbi:spidroin-2 [Heterocephalus glaber]|uniref:Spidroin-2 n=1 Tax=Heterocephalus glaber TaxID=10181 RepID=A0AAX6SGZ4_HETGA|nr:spidroin-2 [Heterocephalus glaber]
MLSLPPRRRDSSAARGGGGAGGRGRGRAGAAPEPRGQTRPGRASPGARGCERAMRARRGEYACPRFPLPSPPVQRSDRAAGGGPTPGRNLCEASSGSGGRGVATPRARAPVSAQCARESERGAERAGCASPGGCRPRPPAAQALPLFSPPPRSIPARPAGKPDRFTAATAAGGSAAAAPGALSSCRVSGTESRAGAGPGICRFLQGSRARQGLLAVLRICVQPNWAVWDRASPFSGHWN